MNPPQYAKDTLDAQILLHSPNQDITIFVEDTNKHSNNFYRILFQRIMPELKVIKIFHLGGRTKCIEKANNLNETQLLKNKPFIIIIDGDFNWVRNEPPPQIQGLYQIQAYCIENLLIDIDTVTEVVKSHIILPDEEFVKKFTFNQWLVEVQPLLNIFKHWALINKISPEKCTTSTAIHKFTNQNKLCPDKINKYCASIQKEYGDTNYNIELNKISTYTSELEHPIDIISGKDYLINHLYEYIKPNLTSKNLLKAQIILNLTQKANVCRFEDLINTIRQFISSIPKSPP